VADVIPALYVCGWLKRGPTGIIGTNLTDAEETVHSIAMDRPKLDLSAPGRPALQVLLRQRDVQPVDWPSWEQLDAAEVAAGQAVGAARVKHVNFHP
jgi:adrenodoxin-NADP+ reductase